MKALNDEVLVVVEALHHWEELLRLGKRERRLVNGRRRDSWRRDLWWSVRSGSSPDSLWPQEDNGRVYQILAVLPDVGQVDHGAQQLKGQGVKSDLLCVTKSRDQGRETQPR